MWTFANLKQFVADVEGVTAGDTPIVYVGANYEDTTKQGLELSIDVVSIPPTERVSNNPFLARRIIVRSFTRESDDIVAP